jgi:molybdate transport system substrate-binding protein
VFVSARSATDVRTAILIAVVSISTGRVVCADELKVLTSGAFAAAHVELAAQFERATGTHVVTIDAPSVGSTPDTIPNRLQRGEAVDVVIMYDTGLDDLTTRRLLVAGSRVALAQSGIGMAVRAGAPKPDISSIDALRRTLLAAGSIAHSSSISGVYISTELLQRLGISEQVKGKTMKIERERVGAVVARGEAEIGFQQISELMPVPGITYVGPLPAAVQRVTTFSAAVASTATHPDAARAFIRFLASPQAAPAIERTGLTLPREQASRGSVGSGSRAPARVEIGAQVASVRSSEFDATDTGFGGRAAWLPTAALSIEGEVNVFPSDFPRSGGFSGQRLEALFGVTAGPAFSRVRPFAKFRPGLLRIGEASGPIVCVLIFPPPLSCTLASGRTLAAFDVGGGLQVRAASRTFFRVDAGDRIIRYPGQVFDSQFNLRDSPFFSHDFRLTVGGGIQF